MKKPLKENPTAKRAIISTFIMTFLIICINMAINTFYVWASLLVQVFVILFLSITYFSISIIPNSIFRNPYQQKERFKLLSIFYLTSFIFIGFVICIIAYINPICFFENGQLNSTALILFGPIYYLIISLSLIIKYLSSKKSSTDKA